MHRIFCCSWARGIFWFRVFGVGFVFKDTTIHPLLFSERNGYVKTWRVGRWLVRYLA